jgi:hypothetical protein
MYVTINILDKACDLADHMTNEVADTEEVFEECYEELYPTAPLAKPEIFGKLLFDMEKKISSSNIV